MIPCRMSTVQEYQCQVVAGGKAVDACLAKELFYLWDVGIVTTGCCCGKHYNSPKHSAFISVFPEFVPKMMALGYVCTGHAKDHFVPKTKV